MRAESALGLWWRDVRWPLGVFALTAVAISLFDADIALFGQVLDEYRADVTAGRASVA